MKKPNPFYNSKRWKKKRKAILRKYDYLCQESKRYGRTVQAEVVHHIYPLELYPELALIDWNLIPLSKKEHSAMHDRNTKNITAKGLRWQEKQKKNFENLKKTFVTPKQ